MADWQEIGIQNFRAGVTLVTAQQYRSAVSRFYYAAFSVLTHALAGRFAAEAGQETPNHKGLPKLIRNELPGVSDKAKAELVTLIRRLYAARLDADYRRRTTDRQTAQDARRDLVALFEALGVNYGE